MALGKENPRYFAEKILPYQVIPDLLSEMYPQARELILVRDFRDLLSSVLAFNRKRGYQAFGRDKRDSDLEYVKTTLFRSANSLLKRWRQHPDTTHLVRYEDLVLDPRDTLGGILRYLNLDDSDRAIEETLDRASRDADGSMQHRTVKDPAASIGRWQKDLPDELKAACNEALSPILAEFGYKTRVRVPETVV
jgi:hypothetical protein